MEAAPVKGDTGCEVGMSGVLPGKQRTCFVAVDDNGEFEHEWFIGLLAAGHDNTSGMVAARQKAESALVAGLVCVEYRCEVAEGGADLIAVACRAEGSDLVFDVVGVLPYCCAALEGRYGAVTAGGDGVPLAVPADV